MIRKSSLFLLLILGCFISDTYAHALWIETAPNGKKGVPQEIRIFFGEYSEGNPTPTAKWFSDTRSFGLVLITPDNQEIKLTPTQQPQYFTATFTPDKDGVYTILMHHLVKEVYHGNRLDYNSSAQVKVGNATTAIPSFSNIGIYADNKAGFLKDQEISFTAYLDGKPAAKTEVEVVAPNGWSKKFYTDSTGSASFKPLWPGKYNLEFSKSDKKDGNHEGKPYETAWRGANCVVDVSSKK
jgi:hypothetical protein